MRHSNAYLAIASQNVTKNFSISLASLSVSSSVVDFQVCGMSDHMTSILLTYDSSFLGCFHVLMPTAGVVKVKIDVRIQ